MDLVRDNRVCVSHDVHCDFCRILQRNTYGCGPDKYFVGEHGDPLVVVSSLMIVGPSGECVCSAIVFPFNVVNLEVVLG